MVAAVKAAGLVDTLSGAGPFTVFAPTNAAFAKLPAGTVDKLVKPEMKDQLTKVLTYHVVAGRLTASDIAAKIRMRPRLRDADHRRRRAADREDAGPLARPDRRAGEYVASHNSQRHAVEWRHPCRRRGADAVIFSPANSRTRAGGGAAQPLASGAPFS